MVDRRQAYLSPLTDYTVYSRELIRLDLAMEIIEAYPDNRPIAIFIDSQPAIKAIKFARQQSGQYLLRDLSESSKRVGGILIFVGYRHTRVSPGMRQPTWPPKRPPAGGSQVGGQEPLRQGAGGY